VQLEVHLLARKVPIHSASVVLMIDQGSQFHKGEARATNLTTSYTELGASYGNRLSQIVSENLEVRCLPQCAELLGSRNHCNLPGEKLDLRLHPVELSFVFRSQPHPLPFTCRQPGRDRNDANASIE
jgi:hypothetical protein